MQRESFFCLFFFPLLGLLLKDDALCLEDCVEVNILSSGGFLQEFSSLLSLDFYGLASSCGRCCKGKTYRSSSFPFSGLWLLKYVGVHLEGCIEVIILSSSCALVLVEFGVMIL
ncbi:hypothetical protein KI387_002228, partial [Taxus chinensis]